MFDHDQEETKPAASAFDFEAFPADTLFVDRRGGKERRGNPGPSRPSTDGPRPHAERRERKERRRRIDPTTFEKQYTEDEIEFMNAMQQFKMRSGKSFPSHGEVLRVALTLGYRKLVMDEEEAAESAEESVDVGPIELAGLSGEE
jgi:hypothetical protein